VLYILLIIQKHNGDASPENYPNVRRLASLSSICGKVPMQNVFTVAWVDKTTPCFSDGELEKKLFSYVRVNTAEIFIHLCFGPCFAQKHERVSGTFV
jgi:hypothetical protein